VIIAFERSGMEDAPARFRAGARLPVVRQGGGYSSAVAPQDRVARSELRCGNGLRSPRGCRPTRDRSSRNGPNQPVLWCWSLEPSEQQHGVSSGGEGSSSY